MKTRETISLDTLCSLVEVTKHRYCRKCAEDDPSYDYWELHYNGIHIGTVEETSHYTIRGRAYASNLASVRVTKSLDDCINNTIIAFVQNLHNERDRITNTLKGLNLE